MSLMPSEQRMPTALIIQDQADAWIERKAALEKAGFRVIEVKNHKEASLSLRDAKLGIDLLITSPDFSEPQLQLAAEAVEQHGLPVIMTAEMAYPIGIHGKVATLIEPVSNAELISTARTLLFNEKLD
jgi:DNA-binding NtrC family response regulator